MGDERVVVAVSHRIGHLDVGDAAVVIAVAAEHRAEAFAVCRAVIEDIKSELPVWKRQVEADGTTARRQRAIRSALARLRQDGVIEEESEGRYRITSVVEIVLSSERLRELVEWLSEQRPEEIDTEDIDADHDDAAVPTEDEEPAS